jgi:site-specific recombinase XerD
MNRFHRFDVLAAWYAEHLSIQGYRPRTQADYLFELSFFRRWLEKNTELADIDDLSSGELDAYVASLYDRHLAPGTIHHKCSALLNFLGAIYEENKHYTDLRPHISLPRTGKKLPAMVFSEQETQRVFEYLEEATADLVVRELPHAILLRDHAIMELLYSTGIRLAEVVHLDLCDIDGDGGLVHIRRGKGGKDRVVPIGAVSLGVLQRYIHEARPKFTGRNDAVFVTRFGSRIGEQTLRHTVKRVMAACGITRRVTVHGMRHTCATHMLNHGADIRYVQELLGHASLSSIQVYTHVSIGKLKETHRKHHPRERGEL